MEFGFGQGWFDRFAYDNSAFALTLLREMVVTMSARLARMREETLDDHKADRLEFVRRILAFAGLDKPARDPHRHTWSRIGPAIRVPSCTHLLMTATSQRLAWRVEYDRAMLAATVLPPEGADSADTGTDAAHTTEQTDSNDLDLGPEGQADVC
ncbi:Uncharacterised protein [Nocardia farcinica]|uniref:hypothetical protein n=1 Tax=Nocardia farcinica TaxID=37329 RepID=UPI000E02C6A5|nr:hypothetical protein [Nocardia farcinica]SUE31177.1 Uncharacterised protein [Nocardia farcinica]